MCCSDLNYFLLFNIWIKPLEIKAMGCGGIVIIIVLTCTFEYHNKL